MSLRRLLPALALVAMLGGCVPVPTRPAVAAPEAAPVSVPASVASANDELNAALWMQTSVEYRLAAGQTWRSALTQLDRAIKTPAWDALTPDDRGAALTTGLPLAVIVDVDETVLDNSPYAARLIKGDGSHGDVLWQQWVKEEVALPVPGALEFARAAAARGVTLFYITNRVAELAPATLSNLRKLGFPLKDDSQLLTRGAVTEGCVEVGSQKTCRRRQVGHHFRVLLAVGDSLSDLQTIPSNTPEGREAAVRPYLSWVGERWFVLPNPVYGSWEAALYGDNSNLPEAEKRARKRAALRD